ncbi:hypothetical protein RD792_010415 [Penstemon davidsonii]|uniref:Uncharacterized protein n=1 Tax=Penstemon davidsonii TaxID=160366 RepID=A0ABR0D1T1_9LAMI|nr:hypothetical protein RD792_010415 [Penstemon davidsonii]
MLSLQLCTHPRPLNTTTSSIIKIPASQCNYKHTISNTNINISSSPALRSRLAAAASNDSVIMSDHEKKISAIQLPEGLEAEVIPKHVAVIMDGHRRWAKKNMLTVEQGHRASWRKGHNGAG